MARLFLVFHIFVSREKKTKEKKENGYLTIWMMAPLVAGYNRLELPPSTKGP